MSSEEAPRRRHPPLRRKPAAGLPHVGRLCGSAHLGFAVQPAPPPQHRRVDGLAPRPVAGGARRRGAGPRRPGPGVPHELVPGLEGVPRRAGRQARRPGPPGVGWAPVGGWGPTEVFYSFYCFIYLFCLSYFIILFCFVLLCFIFIEKTNMVPFRQFSSPENGGVDRVDPNLKNRSPTSPV